MVPAMKTTEDDPDVGVYAPDMVDPDTLDLSGQNIEKLGRANSDVQLNVSTLILDGNSLQRLDNIHTYQCLEKVRRYPPDNHLCNSTAAT